MNTDQIINNLRHAKPKVYTMAVAQAIRSYTKKNRDTVVTHDEQAMIEAIVEGVVYSMVPLLAATLAEMQAAAAPVGPPMDEGPADPDATTVESPPLLDPGEIEPAKPHTAYDWSSEGELDAAVERITGIKP